MKSEKSTEPMSPKYLTSIKSKEYYQGDADDAGLEVELYRNWVICMTMLQNFIEHKSKVVWVNTGENTLQWNDYTVGINFVNSNYLELMVCKGPGINISEQNTEILSLRLESFEDQDLVVMCTVVLLILNPS